MRPPPRYARPVPGITGGRNSRAPERLVDLAGDFGAGEADVVQVVFRPAGELGALHAAQMPRVELLQGAVEEAVAMMIYHCLEFGHVDLLLPNYCSEYLLGMAC